MAESLQVLPNRDSPKPGHRFTNVDSDHTDDNVLVKQDEGMIARLGIVGVVFNVGIVFAAILEKNLAPDGVESAPLIFVGWTAELMLTHIRRES